MAVSSAAPDLNLSALRAAKEVFRENKTLTLVSSSGGPDGGVWAGKVYFAEHEGDLYVALEQGRNFRNVRANPRVFFVIEHGTPTRFLQGEGIAEVLGDIAERPERHIIFRHAFELVAFAKSFPGVQVVRIRPTRLYISDFTGDWQPRAEVEVDERVREAFRTTLRMPRPRWQSYLQAVRAFSFTVTLMPVLAGALLADTLDWRWLSLTLLGSLLLHAGVNVLSDFNDYRRGADTWTVLGSSRVLVDGWLTPRQVLWFGLALLLLGGAVGVLLAAARGPAVLWFGLAGVVLGVGYTWQPLGLKYRALGDLAVFLAFGPLMTLGAYYVQERALAWPPAVVAIPLGLLTVGVLHGNNFRDVAEDRRSGYRTLAQLLGPRGSSVYYLLLVVGAYAAVVVSGLTGMLPAWTLLALLSAPLAGRNVRIAFRPVRVAFTFLDLLTAQLHLVFGLLLVLGLLLARLA
jgi:1,4-dihydroxy-2-naphthoate octaprenyltransferase